MVSIQHANVDDVPALAPLFDAYRQFYEQPADLEKAHTYLTARLEAEESTILIARDDAGEPLGFTQLYRTFCSVTAAPIWVLYDLFVAPKARRQGIGRILMEAAQSFGAQSGAAWMKLETAHTNLPGQALYESLGWKQDKDFRTYTFTLEHA